MLIKASELKHETLDWAVAKCHGYFSDQGDAYWMSPAGVKHFLDMREADGHGVHWTHGSTDWSEAGPIIEQEEILTPYRAFMLTGFDGPQYGCHTRKNPDNVQWGDTHLIAAMRCYVANKLGEEIDIPVELIKNNNKPKKSI